MTNTELRTLLQMLLIEVMDYDISAMALLHSVKSVRSAMIENTQPSDYAHPAIVEFSRTLTHELLFGRGHHDVQDVRTWESALGGKRRNAKTDS